MIKTSVFKIQIVCPGCKNYHAVSGIVDTDICRNCGKQLNVKGVLIDNMFGFMDREKYMNGYLSGGIEQMGGSGAYKLEYSSMPPYCEECFAVIPEDTITAMLDSGKPYSCAACGHKMPVRKADIALKEFHPKAIGVINDSSGSDVGKDDREKESLLVYKCMTCGAALELNDDTKRTIQCKYCDNENYLPDAVWVKLHPNREVQPLFVVMDLSEQDLKASIDYFLNVTPLSIYSRHFENFIRSYFERPFITPAFLSWLKSFLSAKNNEEISFNMDITKIQKYFYDNLKLGLNSHPGEVKIAAAEFGNGLPTDLQTEFSDDPEERVRFALAKNTGLNKQIIKKLQVDSSEAVKAEAKKQKTGFLSRFSFMKKLYITISILILVISCHSCKGPHNKVNYMPLVKELHGIECEQVKRSGINFVVNDTNIYTFRGIAFDRIMTQDVNAVLIAQYEDLYQKLAAMEYEMDENEKAIYREDVKKEYLKPCY